MIIILNLITSCYLVTTSRFFSKSISRIESFNEMGNLLISIQFLQLTRISNSQTLTEYGFYINYSILSIFAANVLFVLSQLFVSMMVSMAEWWNRRADRLYEEQKVNRQRQIKKKVRVIKKVVGEEIRSWIVRQEEKRKGVVQEVTVDDQIDSSVGFAQEERDKYEDGSLLR